MELRDITPFNYSVALDEGADGNQWLIVEGIAQRADAPNANKRIYPRTVLEKALGDERFQEGLKARGVLGELDHPDDGKTSLKRIAHIVLEAKLLPNGDVWSKFLILNNPDGERLKELFRANARVGVSSRGSGSVAPGNGQHAGLSIVQEDFRISTWDFVTTPSTFGAYPTPANESRKVLEAGADDDYSSFGDRSSSYSVGTRPTERTAMPATTHNPSTPGAGAAAEVTSDGHEKPGTKGQTFDMPQASAVGGIKGTNPEKEKGPHNEDMCAYGEEGCGKTFHECVCMEGFDSIDNTKNEEDAYTPMTNKNDSKDARVVESLVRQNRITERIAGADRAVSAQLINALVAKIRAASATPTFAEDTTALGTEIAGLKAQLESTNAQLASLTTENAELKRFAEVVKAKVAEAETTDDEDTDTTPVEVLAYVEGVLEHDPDAADWKDYLLEASTVEDARERHRKMKKSIRNESTDLPRPGAKSPLTEGTHTRSTDPSLRLAQRAASINRDRSRIR